LQKLSPPCRDQRLLFPAYISTTLGTASGLRFHGIRPTPHFFNLLNYQHDLPVFDSLNLFKSYGRRPGGTKLVAMTGSPGQKIRITVSGADAFRRQPQFQRQLCPIFHGLRLPT
jgi:hypothetical protein